MHAAWRRCSGKSPSLQIPEQAHDFARQAYEDISALHSPTDRARLTERVEDALAERLQDLAANFQDTLREDHDDDT